MKHCHGFSNTLYKHRRYQTCCRTAMFVVLMLMSLCPILYVTIVMQPNSLNTQLSSQLNVRQFQRVNTGVSGRTGSQEVEDDFLGDKLVDTERNSSLNGPYGGSISKNVNQSKWIIKTHSANETLKHKLTIENLRRAHSNLCPVFPRELVGRLPVKEDMTYSEIPTENIRMISNGGLFRPTNCTAREKVAIVIPYRDREPQLQILLSHLHVILQRQQIQYGIYVIEMANPTQFNRGLLANVGFLTASSIADYTCYVIHDVDLVMADDRNMYRCGRVIRHLVAFSSKYDDNLPYLSYFGGVNAFSTNQFWAVNGFSNLFFGGGGEDDDMVSRIISTGSHFSRPRKEVGGYIALKHGSKGPNPTNPHRMALLYSSSERKKLDGVRTVKYSRLALEFKRLYTWVLISVKESKIMEKYQEFLQVPEAKDRVLQKGHVGMENTNTE